MTDAWDSFINDEGLILAQGLTLSWWGGCAARSSYNHGSRDAETQCLASCLLLSLLAVHTATKLWNGAACLRAALFSVLNPLTHLPPSSMLLTQTRLPGKTSHCRASVRSPLRRVRDLRLSQANRIRQTLCCRDESMGKNDGSVQSQVPARSRVWPCTCNPRAASRDRKITRAVWSLL